MIVLFMGPPGAGKGTQAEELVKKHSLAHISTGEMFRSAASEQTELGLKAKDYMERGALVPDEVTIGIVKERMAKPDCEKGCLLDGFPRTIAQAEALDEMLTESGQKIDYVVYFDASDDILVARLTGRRICQKCQTSFHVIFHPPKNEGVCDDCGGELYAREDDKEETARHRLDVYAVNTAPLLDYYLDSGRLTEIDASGSLEEITAVVNRIILDVN